MRRPVRQLGALPTDWRDFGRSLVPFALLALAAAVVPLRIPVLVALGAGAAVGIARDAPVRWAWAAAVPAAVGLAWGLWPAPLAAADGSDCANPTSPVATWRALEAIVVLATLGGLAGVLRASRTSLLLRLPARPVVRWSIVGFLVTGPVALVLGPNLAGPFFGPIDYHVTMLGAVVPALLFAVANGAMEELVYRGALLGWSARVMGVGPAVVGQAIVFGLAHSGADVAGNPVPLSLALGVGGLLAGIIAVRTGSLLLPMAIHIGLDIPIYYAFACAN
jgi:membrane protease YdiL (CAAX protease family)